MKEKCYERETGIAPEKGGEGKLLGFVFTLNHRFHSARERRKGGKEEEEEDKKGASEKEKGFSFLLNELN